MKLIIFIATLLIFTLAFSSNIDFHEIPNEVFFMKSEVNTLENQPSLSSALNDRGYQKQAIKIPVVKANVAKTMNSTVPAKTIPNVAPVVTSVPLAMNDTKSIPDRLDEVRPGTTLLKVTADTVIAAPNSKAEVGQEDEPNSISQQLIGGAVDTPFQFDTAAISGFGLSDEAIKRIINKEIASGQYRGMIRVNGEQMGVANILIKTDTVCVDDKKTLMRKGITKLIQSVDNCYYFDKSASSYSFDVQTLVLDFFIEQRYFDFTLFPYDYGEAAVRLNYNINYFDATRADNRTSGGGLILLCITKGGSLKGR